MDSAYSVPESWQSGGQSFTYTVTLPVPITSQVMNQDLANLFPILLVNLHAILQKENTVVIPNGLLRPPGEKVYKNLRYSNHSKLVETLNKNVNRFDSLVFLKLLSSNRNG